MLVYAGIDEAGYGPILGPLVVARSVFLVDGQDPELAPPSLWKKLWGAVCRLPGDERDRIAIGDSKALYSPASGLAQLERGVLGFLQTLGTVPSDLQGLLRFLACGQEADLLDHPCYLSPCGGPSLPAGLPAPRLCEAAARLQGACGRVGVRLAEAGAAVVLEDRFNRLVRQRGNKALCAWSFVSAHLQAIWDRYGEDHPYVVIDRQGGRIYYLELLAELFPGAHICIHEESPPVSRYEITEGGRRMRVTVQVGSERHHLPAAFASMTAKYVRELMMMRFQAYWRLHAPLVRPTWGYHRDGRRFLDEIAPLIPALGLQRERLVRCC